MPELPEVETIRRSLESKLLGRTIEKVYVFLERIVKKPGAGEFCRLLAGRKITSLDRRGKYLLVRLEGGYTWVVHLRMTGQLIYAPEKLKHRHLRLAFLLDNGHWLNFIDMRTFGSMYLLPDDRLDEIRGLATMGPEPLSDRFSVEEFYRRLQKRKRAVKTVLLDQMVVAGLGNIYADEALFLAGIDPRREVASLSKTEIERLHQAVVRALRQGLRNRGTTFRDYLDGAGEKGKNQYYLNVYHRSGKPCRRCGTEIVKIRVGGRGTSFCPNCQK